MTLKEEKDILSKKLEKLEKRRSVLSRINSINKREVFDIYNHLTEKRRNESSKDGVILSNVKRGDCTNFFNAPFSVQMKYAQESGLFDNE